MMEYDDNTPDWMIARHAIRLFINDKSEESREWLNSRPKNIYVTSAVCFLTFFDAAITFDSKKMSDASAAIKKIEEECHGESGWLYSVKSKFFYGSKKDMNLETSIYEQIVVADSLICQSLLSFMQSDLSSCVKGGWMLRRAWKIYQETYDQLILISKKLITEKHANDSPLLPAESIVEDLKVDFRTEDMEDYDFDHDNTNEKKALYSFPNKTVSDFSYFDRNSSTKATASFPKQLDRPSTSKNLKNTTSDTVKHQLSEDDLVNETYSDNTLKEISLIATTSKAHKLSARTDTQTRHVNGYVNRISMSRSTSLFSSLHDFGSSIIGSTSSFLGFTKLEEEDEPVHLDLSTVSRLLTAVCFGYGVLRLAVSIAPSRYLRWLNIFGFKGDRNIALKCLTFSRAGEDLRAPLSSLTLLWYHTFMRPLFALDGTSIGAGVEEATKILHDNNEEFGESSLFLFFKGRKERLKPDIPAAIETYKLSVSHSTQNAMKILGLHELGWCNLNRLEWTQAGASFEELSRTSHWSKGFYSYASNICQGAETGQAPNAREILSLLDEKVHKQQIEKYIERRVHKFPSETFTPLWAKNLPDNTPWTLYCFELLYLWNTLPSCSASDLRKIITICTPGEDMKSLHNEPMIGLSLLIRGASLLCLSDILKEEISVTSGSAAEVNTSTSVNDIGKCANEAMESFKACLLLRSENPSIEIKKDLSGSVSDDIGDIHISAFAKYELGVMLLKNAQTRHEGKALLNNIPSEYKNYDFEDRLNVRITATLKSVERFEAKRCKESV